MACQKLGEDQLLKRVERTKKTKGMNMKLLTTHRYPESVSNRFSDLEQEINRFFSNPFTLLDGAAIRSKWNWSPSLDVVENKDELKVSAELPGMSKDDVNVTFEDGVLELSGERKSEHEENKDNVHFSERSYGTFHRRINLPQGVDPSKAKASYKDGVLTVTLPKVEEQKPRKIEVNVK